jgi:hypothetical protein
MTLRRDPYFPGFFSLENMGGRVIDATEHPGTLPPSVTMKGPRA